MVISYKKKKEEVIEIYNDMERFLYEVSEYYKDINISNPLKRKEGLIKKIRADIEKVKNDKFKIIVAGEAKSGKSTFINAYLGIDLLPVDVKQCTSVLLEIKYSKKFKLVATYADGRIEVVNEPEAVKTFLKKHASLDDDYRDIPVPTINEEILVKAGRKANNKTKKIKIFEEDIKNLIASESVQAANIYHLSLKKYESKIRQYISSYIDNWFNIVTKIEIFYPLSDSLKGVEIIDSPGVCARGGVSEVTTEYIKDANAIIFLKPITGQAIESAQFSQFMNNTIVGRNKEALFLIFTRVAQMNENDLMRLQEETYRQFKQLNKENIVYIKSAYQNLGLYVEDRKYIIGFQNTTGIYLINSDLKLSLEGNYIINDSKHTLVKELKAYKYNDKTAVYEITTYHKGEALYLYETDMQNLIYFKTENGDKGYIDATKDDYKSTTGEFYIEEERLVDYFDGEEISWAG